MRITRSWLFVAAAVALATGAVGASASGERAEAGQGFKVVGHWGKDGSGNGQFVNASGIATDTAGNVYVADTDNHRIQVFTKTGGFVRKWGTRGNGNGQFDSAADVDIAPDGTVWVADQQNSRLQQFSSTGAFMTSIEVGLELPRGIAVDGDGAVYAVVDGVDSKSGFRRFVKTQTGWRQDGDRMGAGELRMDEVEASPDGTIYLTTTKTNPPYDARIRRYSRDGKELGSIKRTDTTSGIGIDLDCNIWSSEFLQRRIVKYSPAGKLLATASSPDLVAPDIAVGPTGDLYVIHQSNGIDHFAENKAKPATAVLPGVITVVNGKAKVKFALPGVACPAQVGATATIKGKGVSGKAKVKVAAGKTTVVAIPVHGPSGKTVPATFKIVLKTNGRPTTQVRKVKVSFSK